MTRAILAAAALAVLVACGDQPAITETSADAEVRNTPPEQNRDIALARAATAQFHRFETAKAAGYDFLFLGICMEDPQFGGMGYHYVDTTALDATLHVTQPEAVMYEPGPNGQLRLVGLEYVVPKAAWTGATPPRLFGRELQLNQFDLYALHLWIWRDNPVHIFADWNPNVDCDDAPAVAARRHH